MCVYIYYGIFSGLGMILSSLEEAPPPHCYSCGWAWFLLGGTDSHRGLIHEKRCTLYKILVTV